MSSFGCCCTQSRRWLSTAVPEQYGTPAGEQSCTAVQCCCYIASHTWIKSREIRWTFDNQLYIRCVINCFALLFVNCWTLLLVDCWTLLFIDCCTLLFIGCRTLLVISETENSKLAIFNIVSQKMDPLLIRILCNEVKNLISKGVLLSWYNAMYIWKFDTKGAIWFVFFESE